MTKSLYVTFFQTPLGSMIGVASNRGLCALEFIESRRLNLLSVRLNQWYSTYTMIESSSSVLETSHDWLSHYFSGNFLNLGSLPLDVKGTSFECEVWDTLLEISPGMTATYGQIAQQVGRQNGARAVGAAIGRNPVSLIVPCHRVVGSSGSLVGYGGGLERKEWLLYHEGILKTPRPN